MEYNSEIMADIEKVGWLSDQDFEICQRSVSIPCVDIVPVRPDPYNPYRISEVGLILRKTPEGKLSWCHIGGRKQLNETNAQALSRQLYDTLGPNILFLANPYQQPHYVADTLRQSRPTIARLDAPAYDLRKHATALTFAKRVEGNPDPRGEAEDFKWFQINELPSTSDFGFNIGPVIRFTVAKLEQRLRSNQHAYYGDDEFYPEMGPQAYFEELSYYLKGNEIRQHFKSYSDELEHFIADLSTSEHIVDSETVMSLRIYLMEEKPRVKYPNLEIILETRRQLQMQMEEYDELIEDLNRTEIA